MTRTTTSVQTAARGHSARSVSRGLTVLGVAVCALAGCTSSQDAAGSLPAATATTPAATPRPSVTTSSTKPVSTTVSAPAVGKPLAAAIDDLSSKSRNLLRLDDARKQLKTGNDALKQARTSITTLREAVYGSTRNCTAARVQNSTAREKALYATNKANGVIASVISRRGELVELAQAATAVERQVAAQGSTLAAMPNVKAAVASSRTAIIEETSATNKVNEAAASLRSNALQVSANGSQILGKTC